MDENRVEPIKIVLNKREESNRGGEFDQDTSYAHIKCHNETPLYN
jgi:hypothetical protein